MKFRMLSLVTIIGAFHDISEDLHTSSNNKNSQPRLMQKAPNPKSEPWEKHKTAHLLAFYSRIHSLQHDVIQSMISSFVERLWDFIEQPCLEASGDESQATRLRQDLEGISNIIARTVPCKIVVDHLHLAKHMFKAIVDSPRLLEFYSLTEPEQDLVQRMVHLNIRILQLHDPSGVPDRGIQGYDTELSMIVKTSIRWQERLENWRDLPKSVRDILMYHFKEVDDMVAKMASTTPGPPLTSPSITFEFTVGNE